MQDFGLYKNPAINSKPGQVSAMKVSEGKVGNGYFADYTVPSDKTIKSFSTTWFVPNNPSNDSVLALWNGMESENEKTFMQPV